MAQQPSEAASAAPVDWTAFDVVIRPSRSWVPLGLVEAWTYRELLAFLVWRDIKVRYKQTLLGVAWAVIQPFFSMVVFTIFFGRLGGMEQRLQEGVPYPLFAYAGLVPWSLFAFGLAAASNSIVGSANLIRKVYFPRLLVPLGSVLAGLVDFCMALLVLFGMMVFYGRVPTVGLLFLPLMVALAMVTALGVGLWLSALTAQFRDVQYTLPFLTQLWLFATPIVYPSALVPERWRVLYGLNPMAGVTEGFRWALLSGPPPGPMIWASVLVSGLLLVTGAYYFKRTERAFADVV